MFTAKGSILLHPILGTRMRHRTVNFSYFFFSANHGSSENDKTLVFGTGRGSTQAQGPNPEALVSLSHSLA